MGFKFVGGPYDGRDIEHTDLNRIGGPHIEAGSLGVRAFMSMPPVGQWESAVRGAKVDGERAELYEREFTPEGVRWVWDETGSRLERAQLEARLEVQPLAKSALLTLSDDLRKSVVDTACDLQRSDPATWSDRLVKRVSADEPLYLVRLPQGLRAFLRVLPTGRLELMDIVSAETLRLFTESYAAGGAAR